MKNILDIWNNKNNRSGGFYEMAIQVSDNKTIEPIKKLTKAVFDINFISGPYDNGFKHKAIDLEFFDNIGLIAIENKKIPFKTYLISEEGNDGDNWLDISIYSGILKEILGEKYKTHTIDAKWHIRLDNLLVDILKKLNSIYSIKLGILGFEVSGVYTLEYLIENELKENDISHSRFYVNSDNFNMLNHKNHDKIIKL